MKINSSILFLLVVFITACHSSAPKTEGGSKIDTLEKEGTYVNYEMGWAIDIPDGFKSLSDNRMKANEEKGRAAIGKSGDEKHTDSLIHLVNFQKNQFNKFSATIQKYNEKRDGDYAKNNKLMRKLIFDAYTKQNIRIDTASGNQKCQCSWIDTFHMGTGIMHSEGNETGNGFVVLGSYGGEGIPEPWGWRTELEIINSDQFLLRAFNISPEGEEAKATETIYHRIKL